MRKLSRRYPNCLETVKQDHILSEQAIVLIVFESIRERKYTSGSRGIIVLLPIPMAGLRVRHNSSSIQSCQPHIQGAQLLRTSSQPARSVTRRSLQLLRAEVFAQTYPSDCWPGYFPNQIHSLQGFSPSRHQADNFLMGVSRQGNVESLGYMVLCFAHSLLLWQGLKTATDKEKNELVKEKKMARSGEELCEGLPLISSRRTSITPN